jgi:t-SNARE complex subunit (syntaxin)
MDIHDIHALHYWKKCVEAEQKDEEMGYPASDSESESDADSDAATAAASRPSAVKYYRSYRYNRDRCYIILAYTCVAYMIYWSFMDVNRSEN